MKAAGSSVKPYRNQPAGIVGRKPPVDASCCPRFPPAGCQVPQTSKSAVSHPALKKLLLEVIALQPVPQPGQSAVALAEAEGLPESSRGSSASEPPGSRPETDCTPGRGARATQPETIHLRRSFFLNQHPQGVPALRDKPAGVEPGGAQELRIIRRFGYGRFGGSRMRPHQFFWCLIFGCNSPAAVPIYRAAVVGQRGGPAVPTRFPI